MCRGMSSASALSGCSSNTVQLTRSPPLTICETLETGRPLTATSSARMLACTRARLTPPPPRRAVIQASSRDLPSPEGTASSRRVPPCRPLRLSGSAASTLASEERHLA
uniref:Uncharacterized protein n=1 Tax=Arundo donax TaxID=35708 RepID=A0A0A9TCS1_ARUDO